MKKPLLLLFDGNALVHRAFHALPPLTVSKTGEMVNATYGFALMLLKTINELKPTQCAIAFDSFPRINAPHDPTERCLNLLHDTMCICPAHFRYDASYQCGQYEIRVQYLVSLCSLPD